MAEEKLKRKRGAQPGNKNALKHGFYARALTRDKQKEYADASELHNIDEEIALLRLELKNAISDSGSDKLFIIIKATNALEKLMRTRYRITDKKQEDFRNSFHRMVTDVLSQVKGEAVDAVLSRKLG